MSLYLLDTDIISLFQRGHAKVCTAVSQHVPEEIAITVITVEEQLSGWYTELRRAKDRERLAAIYQRMADTVQFYASMRVVSFTEPAIVQYEQLARQKIKIRKSDLRIAAIALKCEAVLVTRNRSDFARVSGLVIEDWSK